MNKILLFKICAVVILMLMVSTVWGKTFLITEHDGSVDHSMLVVIDENGNLTGFMSKQPAVSSYEREGGFHLLTDYDKAYYDRDSGNLTIKKTGKDVVYNLTDLTKNPTHVSCIQLTTNPAMDNKIAENILYEKQSSNPFGTWFTSNCAVTIEQILEKSGYLERNIWNDLSYIVPSVLYSAPLRLENRVVEQEQRYAKRTQQNNQAENSDSSEAEGDGEVVVSTEGSQTPNGDNTSKPENNPEGDNVISGDNGGDGSDATPSGDSVVNDNEQQTGSDKSNNTPSGDSVSSSLTDTQIDWEHNSNDDIPDLGDVLEKIKDKSPIVGPNIPHYRILWLFSGENWGDVAVSVVENAVDLFKSGNFSSIKDKISEEIGYKDMKAALESIGD